MFRYVQVFFNHFQMKKKSHKLISYLKRNASWAIRNMVARCHNQKKKFLEFGAEDLLNVALKNFEKNCSHDIKSALRDLGCVVKLDEQWTGKGGMIHTSSKITEDE